MLVMLLLIILILTLTTLIGLALGEVSWHPRKNARCEVRGPEFKSYI